MSTLPNGRGSRRRRRRRWSCRRAPRANDASSHRRTRAARSARTGSRRRPASMDRCCRSSPSGEQRRRIVARVARRWHADDLRCAWSSRRRRPASTRSPIQFVTQILRERGHRRVREQEVFRGRGHRRDRVDVVHRPDVTDRRVAEDVGPRQRRDAGAAIDDAAGDRVAFVVGRAVRIVEERRDQRRVAARTAVKNPVKQCVPSKTPQP